MELTMPHPTLDTRRAEPSAARHSPSAPDVLMDRFCPTTLADLERVSLLNRVDTKYVLDPPRLLAALAGLTRHYRVLQIGGTRRHRYRTVYFDTPSFELYPQHHTGRATRVKARGRTYLDSGLAFFEVKVKNNRGRTIKHRLPTPRLLTELTPEAGDLLARHAPGLDGGLEQKLTNSFTRITLAGVERAERLTLDLDVRFEARGEWGSRIAILPGLAIAELKQAGPDRDSPFARCMRELRVQPLSVSKYCTGVSLLYPELPHNRFKPQLRAMARLAGGGADVR
ncbi:MAG: polyphosphate polymerase domain-containing protein [Chloroflexota bacterium]